MPRKSRPLAERFWEKVAVAEPHECWPWTGARSGPGLYGKVRVDRQTVKAHRVAYELAVGPIPEGLWVLHACDNPPCCNPAHLSLGTHLENQRQKAERGRARGRCGGRGRPDISTVEIAALYAQGYSCAQIAVRFGVTPAAVNMRLKRTGVQLRPAGPPSRFP